MPSCSLPDARLACSNSWAGLVYNSPRKSSADSVLGVEMVLEKQLVEPGPERGIGEVQMRIF